MDCLHALDLNDHQIFYQQVNSIAQVEFLALINHGQTELRFHIETALPEFCDRQASVGALQQTRAKDECTFIAALTTDAGYLIDSRNRD